jgi:hypothetical protein
VSIRLVCASTFTAIGLACSSTAFARVIVTVPATVIYAPPPRAVYYYGYAPVKPVYVVAPPPAPIPVAVAAGTPVLLPAPTRYAIVPASVVTYAQPVMAVPR